MLNVEGRRREEGGRAGKTCVVLNVDGRRREEGVLVIIQHVTTLSEAYPRTHVHAHPCYGIQLLSPIHVFIPVTSLILDRRRYINTQVVWDRASQAHTLSSYAPGSVSGLVIHP